MVFLVIFSGLPGVGKTHIARELARRIEATYLRVDSIEQAILASGLPLNEAGYRAAYTLAKDNLKIGRTVIVDSVNPIQLTRDAWVDIATQAQVRAIEIEVRCSDAHEHRRRVETRTSDIPNHKLPTWEDVVSREYHPWNREHLVIDTANQSIEQGIITIKDYMTRLSSKAA